jgi:integrase
MPAAEMGEDPPGDAHRRRRATLTAWAKRTKRRTARVYCIEWNGKPVQSVKKAFRTAVRLAGLEGKVMPHTLRHTAATWSVNKHASLWQAADLIGMSEEMLRRVYGNHDPDFMGEAADALPYRSAPAKALPPRRRDPVDA